MFVPPPRSQMVGRWTTGPPRQRDRASRGRRMTLSAPAIRGRKRRNGAIPLVMVTAYDEPGARLASAAGDDLAYLYFYKNYGDSAGRLEGFVTGDLLFLRDLDPAHYSGRIGAPV